MSSKQPDGNSLYEAALNHLARYAATEIGLARVLARKVDRWVRAQEDDAVEAGLIAKAAIPAVIARVKAAGALNDQIFADSRARRLTREGKSRRAALAHLTAKGIKPADAEAALADDPARELAAACAFIKRRRAGAFGSTADLKVLGAMARAGYTQETARRALHLPLDEAEALIKSLHS
jgi:regulatory protein